jgi:transposase
VRGLGFAPLSWAKRVEHEARACPRRYDAKKKTFRPTEQDRPDVQEKRRAFLEEIGAVDIDDLVFLDESGCNVAMSSAYGRAPCGVRVRDKKPANWGKNITVVGAISRDRVVCHHTMVGAMNKPSFIHFVKNMLCPRIHRGAVVVLDNLRAHHAPEVREAVEAAGARVLYMPPYSPELNPIELCWSFCKLWLRRLAKRTEEDLRKAIRSTLLRVRTDQLQGWFAHCGFAHFKRSPL